MIELIRDMISETEKRKEEYRVEQQKVVNKMLYDSGILQYMFEVEKEISRFEEKIKVCKELLSETKASE